MIFSSIIEDVRLEIEKMGANDCFKQSLLNFSRDTSLPEKGLWFVANAAISKFNKNKTIRQAVSIYGGDVEDWEQWFDLASTMPDC